MDKEQQTSNFLIQDSIPVRTIGIECEREGKGKFPPLNRYHIWWARRPLIAARTAILASVIDSNHMGMDELIERMGITGKTIEKYKTENDRPKGTLVYEHYGYRRPFTQETEQKDIDAIHDAARKTWDGELPTILDATAGGGAIPFESLRYQFPTVANELNPVASVLLKACLEIPTLEKDISSDVRRWGEKINSLADDRIGEYFPSLPGEETTGYLWAHTVNCPDCGIELPLSPNWWVAKDGSNTGVAVKPKIVDRDVEFDIVTLSTDEAKINNNENVISNSDYNPSNGTVSYGKGDCLNCGVTIQGDEIKEQAQSEGLGYQLYCVEYSDLQDGSTGFRAPTEEDKQAAERASEYAETKPQLASLLSEERYIGPADRAKNYGIARWRDAFTPRQLLTHYEYWQAFEEVKNEIQDEYSPEVSEAILILLSAVADKTIDYNSRFSSWHNGRALIRNTFDRHDFSFKWSFAEALPTIFNYEWALDSVIEAYEEMRSYLAKSSSDDITILQRDARHLPLDDGSIEAVIIDPPYYDNVMYAELADYFYVWMKRYLNDVCPEFFEHPLTNKRDEAVANVAEFDSISGNNSKTELAKVDYEQKMADIFKELNRVLKDNGILTLMFTHKKTEAWDTLTTALIKAGFEIHTSHPISTENQRSLHQAGKNAAKSTIFLAGRKRTENNQPSLWSDVKNVAQEAAREKVRELDHHDVEYSKVDMILASFGPTLRIFSSNYPVIDDEGNEIRPQIALDEAREAVRDYLIETYLDEGIRQVDPITEWYALAWLIFEAQRFPYDEANRLGKGVGIEVDNIKRSHRLWRKKSNDIVLRAHSERVQTPEDKEKSRTTKPIDPDAITFDTDLDKVHATMYVFDSLGAVETEKYIKNRGFETDPGFRATFEALLHVIPPTHDDWAILRDIAATDIAHLIDLDVDADVFRRAKTEGSEQGKLSSFK